jgi:predicted amidophosphoribosyltransferase
MPRLSQLLKNVYPSLLHSAAALLSPQPASCLACGRAYRKTPAHAKTAAAKLTGLCPECLSAVPWIRLIRCPVCGRPDPCGDCARRHDAAFLSNRSAVRYNPFVRELLALYKYRGHEALEPLLGAMMNEAYMRMLAELAARGSLIAFDALVPVPLSRERLAERGFNQAERLAAAVAAIQGIPVCEVLHRTRHSGKQSFKTRGARLSDTRDLFRADETKFEELLQRSLERRQHSRNHAALHISLKLLIIDDIYTTGGTVNACAKAIEEACRRLEPAPHPEIRALTLARS